MSQKCVIAGAQVLDGTGAAATPADVYIAEGTIQEVRPASDNHGAWDVVDARGLTLAPGFIDVHSHADNAPFLPEHDTSRILQGVTTEVVGNCGFSLAPRTPEPRQPAGCLFSAAVPAGRVARLLSLAEAVRKMTSPPAETFRIPARGLLTPGKVAAVVAFQADHP
jgi:N-acyl-D-aspartate/D-glutamate deacylase